MRLEQPNFNALFKFPLWEPRSWCCSQTPACLSHCCLHLHNTGAAARSCVGVKICFVCEALATVGANVVWQSDRETFGMGLIPCSFFTLWLSPDHCRTFPPSCWELSSHPSRAFSPFSTIALKQNTGLLALGLHSHEFCKLPAAVRAHPADFGEWALQDAAGCFNARPGPRSLSGALVAAWHCGIWSEAGCKPRGRCPTVTLSSSRP